MLSGAALAQADTPLGARAAGLGNASVTLSDLWAVHNNIAGITGVKELQAGTYAENRSGVKAFTTVALAGVYPTRYGSYGVSLSTFGDQLFRQQHAGLGIAHKLGQFSIGAKVDVWQIAVKGYGSQKALAFSVGGQAEIVPQLHFGAYAYNLNQAKLATFEDERLPTVMKAGLSYSPYRKLLLAVETEKNIDYDATFKGGIEYQILEDKFTLRSGFISKTNTLTFGAGFKARLLLIDYAFGNATPLGNSHHLSVAYHFSKP
ncbi:hypothetical protein ACSX1A_13905 [Pontibacter sp. MBLB2868]|uniref:hypothetical protein n=1 Tax=Pontibacter sp. MBLB2868 TaxID=3451555 RepID=UPI003F753594